MIPRINDSRSVDWTLFVIIGNTNPPRDPDEDDEDEDGDGEENEGDGDEPPVVREPDED